MQWSKVVSRLPSIVLRSRQPVRFYSSSSETTYAEVTDLDSLREAVKRQSFASPEVHEGVSPEMREKLSQEFDKFLDEFVHSVDSSVWEAENLAEKMSGSDTSVFGEMYESAEQEAASKKLGRGGISFASVNATEADQSYSDVEMYVRQLFHARRVSALGAQIAPNSVYKPFEDLHNPKPIQKTGMDSLIAAGAHLGHATRRLRANCLPFVYGIREGIHIIDLQQTLAGLRRVSRVAEDLARRGGLILYVGTREGQKRTVEKAAQRSHGYYVSSRWTPGTLTNYQSMTEQKQQARRLEVDMADRPTGRQLSPSLYDTIIKPDLVVILNPVENRALLAECARLRIPTTGIVDTDSEPTLLTYPIPGNDDSLRFADQVSGIISLAAQRGRQVRMREFTEVQAAKEKLRQGEAFANETLETPQNTDGLSDAERQML